MNFRFFEIFTYLGLELILRLIRLILYLFLRFDEFFLVVKKIIVLFLISKVLSLSPAIIIESLVILIATSQVFFIAIGLILEGMELLRSAKIAFLIEVRRLG